MRNNLRVCPVCGKLLRQERLSKEQNDTLQMFLQLNLPTGGYWICEAWWCPACECPYLVIWPEVEDKALRRRLAGLPPKGG